MNSKPLTALVEIIYGCNLRCKYCYIGNEHNHLKPIIQQFDSIKKIIDQLKKFGIKEIVLLGGEPTLHPDIERIAQYVKSKGFDAQGIVTNGTKLNDQIIKILKSNEFWIDVSIRAGDDNTFYELTGIEDSYEKMLDGIKLLIRHEIPVGLEFDVTAINYLHLYSSIDKLRRMNLRIKQVQVHRLVPSLDLNESPDLKPKLEHYLEIFPQLENIRNQFGIPAFFEDGFPFCLVDQKYWDFIAPCGCGFTIVTVDPYGNMRHCSCSNKILGNIFVDDINQIWEKVVHNYQPASSHHSICKKCDFLEVCRGGCRSTGQFSNEKFDEFSMEFTPIRIEDTSKKPESKIIFGQKIGKKNTFEEI